MHSTDRALGPLHHTTSVRAARLTPPSSPWRGFPMVFTPRHGTQTVRAESIGSRRGISERAMSAAKEFEAYARDCVRMAGEADSPHFAKTARHGPRVDAGNDRRGAAIARAGRDYTTPRPPFDFTERRFKPQPNTGRESVQVTPCSDRGTPLRLTSCALHTIST